MVMQNEISKRKQQVLLLRFCGRDDAVFCELGTQEKHEMLLASMAANVSTYICSHLKKFVTFSVSDGMVFVAPVDGRCFGQLIFEWNQKKAETFSVYMITQLISEAIVFFHYLYLVNDGIQEKILTVP